MSEHRPSPTDSPWLWLAIFVVGAIGALVLASPKYAWRQAQLERQFLARQRGGQTVARRNEPTGEVGQAVVSLRPLIFGLTFLILAMSGGFWVMRVRRLYQEARIRRGEARDSRQKR